MRGDFRPARLSRWCPISRQPRATRLPKLAVAELDADQRALYAEIAEGPRAQGPQLFTLVDSSGALEGPFNAMLLSPPLGRALQAVGAAVRYGGALTNRAREMAILIAGHAWQSEFEIYAHVAVGRAAGLDDAELHAVSEHDYGRFADDYERLVADTAHALATRSDLTDDEYAAARDGLGLPVLFELTTLIGYYSTLALQLRIFRVGVPDDEPLRRDDD